MRATLLALVLAAGCTLILAAGCTRQPDPAPITAAWTDSFDRADVGGDYFATADAYRITDGVLTASQAYNHPLWLRRKLPRDAAIEFDCWSSSPHGDIKVEAWGDGEHHGEKGAGYTSSGYVFILGGWQNTRNLLARGNEHGADVRERKGFRVEAGRRYHWKIVRKGAHIDWFVDDMSVPFLSLDDPSPYEGKGHEYFGFNEYETELHFDNLSITPL
jgi:hypothetical protein